MFNEKDLCVDYRYIEDENYRGENPVPYYLYQNKQDTWAEISTKDYFLNFSYLFVYDDIREMQVNCKDGNGFELDILDLLDDIGDEDTYRINCIKNVLNIKFINNLPRSACND